MTGPEATWAAALAAAIVASVGVLWSVVSFFLTRQMTRSSSARGEWRSRFEQAHALARSADLNEARTGALLLTSLSESKWVTDTDRATAASVLLSLPAEIREPDRVREVLASVQDPRVADALANVGPGPKGKVELFTNRDGEYGWRVKAANGEVIALSSGGYASETAARLGIESLRRAMG